MENSQTAKEIFFQYSGSKFQMMRDGIYEDYIKYNISQQQEEDWLNQLLEGNIIQLDINNTATLFPMWYTILSHCKSLFIGKIIDFIYTNKHKAENKGKLIAFIAKTEEVIDRMNESCSHIQLSLSHFKNRIDSLKKEENI
jgi:hypothetical protein